MPTALSRTVSTPKWLSAALWVIRKRSTTPTHHETCPLAAAAHLSVPVAQRPATPVPTVRLPPPLQRLLLPPPPLLPPRPLLLLLATQQPLLLATQQPLQATVRTARLLLLAP